MKIQVVRLLAVLLACLPLSGPLQGQRKVDWVGQGSFRILVEVEGRALQQRSVDECPTELEIDFAAKLKELGIDKRADLGSIQVMKIDPKTGRALEYNDYAYARSNFDRPFRWYDAAVPYQFPEFRNTVDRTKGKIQYQDKIRTGYIYNVLGDWKSGRLAWMHTQTGSGPSRYAIYFDLLPDGKEPRAMPPKSWLGDGMPRCDQKSHSTIGVSHTRIDVDDWNEDGLDDLIVGEAYGHVTWWPNLGTKSNPVYRYGKYVFGADDKPIDNGMSAAPKVVDWNGDGIKDLLVGAHWNRVLYYENTGTNKKRQLVYRGPVLLDNQPLTLPFRPLTRGKEAIFKRDYYPVLETVDWDHDGDLDLMAGGYVTGMVFWYENIGILATGQPRLKLRGPLEADGKALNVGHWCAAPCIADFDGDGDLDLVSGNMPMYVKASEAHLHEDDFLQYYENIGTRKQPVLAARPFPHDESFPRGRLATPRVSDFDDDGDLDLVVSTGENIYTFANVGTATKPNFKSPSGPITVPWGNTSIGTDAFVDWNGDGKLDLINGYTVRLNSGSGNPYRWSRTENVLPAGEQIAHPSGIGDDWFWPKLADFDQDGKIDVLFGDWHGTIWFHRNLSTGNAKKFDLKGFRLKIKNGQPLKVGPVSQDVETNFDALQGARTVFTVGDYNQDGYRDLVVGDTFGIIRYFENVGRAYDQRTDPRFHEPVTIGKLGIRGLVDSCDWNNDGKMDVIASAANGKVRVFINQQNERTARFAQGIDPGLPPIEQPRTMVADINGDGDDDLFIASTVGSCFVERSFLSGGYAKAKLILFEQKQGR